MVRNDADPRTLRRLAQDNAYQLPGLEKAFRLTAILAEIAIHPYLKDRLVLKGGTALNLYEGSMERLSVDADLNFLGALDTAELDAEKAKVFAAIEAIANERSVKWRIDKDAHALRSYILAYDTVNGGADTLKLDLNFLERVTVLAPTRAKPPPIFDIDGPPVLCLSLTELAGSKVATMLLRGAARDVFDVATLQWDRVDARLARKVAIFHGFLDNPKLANFDLDRPAKLSKKDWDSDVRNLLRKGSDHELEPIKARAIGRAKSIFPLDASEQRCQDALLKGEWHPELLFGDAKANQDLAHHPAVRWRLKNPDARLPT